ncbi:hypothetical protein Aperf_G00000067747 [Anoplocephala perfoliata]
MDGIRPIPEFRGIIPNSFAHIFGQIAKASAKSTFLVHVSYFEVYNEDVRDLLVKTRKTKLEIKERPDCGVCVCNLSSVMVHSPDEMERLLNLGSRNRSTAATNMNEHSSRSHAIFSITIECSELLGEETRRPVLRRGKLHLVDLAGSERQSKTGAEGQRLQESSKINLSLATLGLVISALADGKSTHVPYRNSKLTRILQDSLGGNSKTVMIANIGPADLNYEESVSTLRYANHAKLIKNAARINEDPKDALIRQFQKEIEELRRQLSGVGTSTEPERLVLSDESPTGLLKKTSGNLKEEKEEKLGREQIAEIERIVDADRRKMEEQKDLEIEQRDEIKRHLEAREEELASAQRTQAEVRRRMEALERRLIVGGQNLLEKAEAQARLLEQSANELRAQEERTQGLRKKLREKKEERINIEEQYNSLQELIGQNVQWHDDVGEWQLRYIAYAGNNIKRAEKDKRNELNIENGFPPVYLSYNALQSERRKIVNSSFVTKERKERSEIGRGGNSVFY